MSFIPAEIIKKKRDGAKLEAEEIQFFIQGYTNGTIPEYQMSALLMAIYFKGMLPDETSELTRCVLDSGAMADLSSIPGFKVDKHSTGGVGDKSSLVLGPLVASLGIPVPMISGRGLGHTGGTLDKLDSIVGFNNRLTLPEFVENIRRHKICFIGQTLEICPADRKMYSLRDVTATIESLPLITASIMSKKLAEGIDGLVLDIKVGSGAFMKTLPQAEALAYSLMSVAKAHGKSVTCLLTDMNQPLGRFAGNGLEVEECIAIMRGEKFISKYGQDLYEDTRELSLWLSAHMILLAGAAKNEKDAYDICRTQLASGKVYEKFLEMCQAQGGDLSKIARAKEYLPVLSTSEGFVSSLDTEQIGFAGITIGAGRQVVSDTLDLSAGIEFHFKIGDRVHSGDTLFTLHGNDKSSLERAARRLKTSINISLQKPARPSLIIKTLR